MSNLINISFEQIFITYFIDSFMKFEFVFLGTGQAIPTSSRNHVSIFVSVFGEGLLFDCGEGTQRQFRKADVNPGRVSRIFLSHWHGDHVLGLSGLIQTLNMSGYNKELHIYGPKGTRRNVFSFLDLFRTNLRFPLSVHEVSDGVIYEGGDFFVEAMPVKHTIPCLSYKVVERDKLRIDKDKLTKLGIRPSPDLQKALEGKSIKVDGRIVKSKDLTYKHEGFSFSVVFDTNYEVSLVKFVKGCDLLICESTYGDEEVETAKEYMHMTSRQAATLAKKGKCKKLLLTHFSQRYEFREKILLKQAREVFENAHLTADLDKITI